MRRASLLILFAGLALALSSPPTARGESFRDDFEERKDEKLIPYGWHAIVDDEHPSFNVTRIYAPYTQEFHTGKASCKFETAGRSTSIETKDFLQIIPARRYLLSAWIKTAKLQGDRAYLSIHWLDKLGIVVSVSQTPAVTGTSDWTPVHQVFEDIPGQARFARIRLNLDGEDLDGQCWFDGVSFIEQLRLMVRAPTHPGFLFLDDEPLRLEVSCPNLDPGHYAIEHTVYNTRGEVVVPPARQPIVVGSDGLLRVAFETPVPVTGAGRFTTTLLGFDDALLAEQVQRFGLQPSVRFAAMGNAFGLVIDPTDPTRDLGPALVRAFGPGQIKYKVWSSALSSLPPATRDSIVERLAEAYRTLGFGEMVGVIAAPPPSPDPMGADEFFRSAPDLLSWLGSPADRWDPPLRGLCERYRSLIRTWQIGDDDQRMGDRQTVVELYPAWRSSILEAIAHPSLGVPAGVGGATAFPSAIPLDFVALMDDPSIPALELPSRLAAEPGRKRYLTIAVPDRPVDDSRQAEINGLTTFLKRLALARTAGVEAIFLAPFAENGRGLLDHEGSVTAAYCGAAAYASALGTATHDPRAFFSEEVTHRVFVGRAHRAIVAWSDAGVMTVDAALGDGSTAVDVAGARRVIPVVDGLQRLDLGAEPVLILVRDLPLIDTQLSLAITPSTLDSRSGPQERTLTLTNAYPREIRGLTLRVRVPEGWQDIPEIRVPALGPGDTLRRPITFDLPPSVTLGSKPLPVEVEFSADRSWRFTLKRSVTITSDLHLAATATLDPDGKRVRVRVEVTNRTTDRITAKLYLSSPGTRPQEFTLLNLQPGKQEIKGLSLHRLPGATKPTQIRGMLRDTDHRRFVNVEAEVKQ